MNKKTALIAILCVLFLLGACGTQAEAPAEPSATASDLPDAGPAEPTPATESDLPAEDSPAVPLPDEDTVFVRTKYEVYSGDELMDGTSFTYDAAGNCVEEKSYDADGTVLWFDRYEYSDDGALLSHRSYTGEEELGWLEIYTYDMQGRMIENACPDEDGNNTEYYLYFYEGDSEEPCRSEYYFYDHLSDITEWTYDGNGNATVCVKSDEDGSVYSTVQYVYDENDLLLEVSTLDENGTELSRELYDYDDYGNRAAYYSYTGDELTDSVLYAYSDTGLLMEKTRTDEDGNVLYSYSYEYDSYGNNIHMLCMDGDGNLLSETFAEFEPLL